MTSANFPLTLHALIDLDHEGDLHESVPEYWLDWAKNKPFVQPEAHIPHLPPLNSRSAIVLGASLHWAQQLQNGSHPSASWKQATQAYWWVVAATSLKDWSLWANPRHPVSTVLEHLELVSRGIGDEPIPEIKKFLGHLNSLCGQLAQAALTQPGSVLPFLKKLNDSLRDFRNRQREADQALLALEETERRSTTAHSAVTRVIRRAIYSHPVPALLVDFLDTHWRRYLYTLYLRDGIDSHPWQATIADVEKLVWLSGEATDEEVRNECDPVYKPIKQRLRNAIFQLHQNDDSAEQFFIELDLLIEARARNLPDAGLPLGELPFDIAEDEALATQATIEPSTMVMQIQRGDCLRLTINGREMRARVVDIDRAIDAYLLADALGDKIGSFDRATMSGFAQRDELAPVAAVSAMSIPVSQLYPLFEKAYDLMRQQSSKLQQSERRDRENRMETQLEEMRRQEAIERARKITTDKQQIESERRQTEARNRLKILRPGALISLQFKDHQRPCYLALIDSQSGQYIFVDRQGQKLAELSINDLIDKLILGQVEILESGSALDNTISGLVRERREFLKEQDEE